MAVKVIKQGIMDTLQDKGRYGFQHMGIPPCGYLDYISAQLSNVIVGNPINAPVFELHFPASSFTFDSDHTICISGANFLPVLNDKSIPMNTAIQVGKNDLLKFMHPLNGKVCYLSINGNIENCIWLNSKSYFSEQLKTNNDFNITKWEATNKTTVPIDLQAPDPIAANISKNSMTNIQAHIFGRDKIRFIPGPHWDDLTSESISNLIRHDYITTTHSNRMGYTLKGPLLQLNQQKSYLSSAVTRGTMQLLPNGDLIILMANHQTIGGYTNIGQIILVDLPKLVQLKNDTPFRFSLTNIETAHWEYKQMQDCFSSL
jgi:antagonist of KipI